MSETISTAPPRLEESALTRWRDRPGVIDYGAIVLCRAGAATMRIDFKDWPLHAGAVITLFPGDVVMLTGVSDDFMVELLQFDRALMREASLQLEQTVYTMLRADRCRRDRPVVTAIIDRMFGLLKIYFSQPECTCLEQLVLYQLKSFYTGFYDWIYRTRDELPVEPVSRRVQELFNRFMDIIARDYATHREVAHYAAALHITSKYLNTIARRIAHHPAKALIDHYAVMQLKQQLRSSDRSIKQLAWDYHFSDTSFFCRYFKQHTGITPQRFRQATTEHL